MTTSGNRNDFDTIMSVVLLVPMAGVLLWALISRNLWQKVIWMWVWLGLTVIAWVLNSYKCKDIPSLFILHALFHITAAMLIIHAASIGVGLDDLKWDVELGFWPWIQLQGSQSGLVMPKILTTKLAKQTKQSV